MEKLNNRLLTTTVLATLFAITSTAFAGPGFRFSTSSKSPVPQPKRHKAYIFGYGGFDSGYNIDSTGAFEAPHYDFAYDPYNIPIQTDFENGATWGGGIGVYSRLLGGSRFEIEGFSSSNDNDTVYWQGFTGPITLPSSLEIETRAVMFNFLKEFPIGQTGSNFYFGGGIGYASTEYEGHVDGVGYSADDSGFAWQLIAGIDFPVTQSLTFFTQYAFRNISEQTYVTNFGDFTQTTDDNPYSHAVVFGARVSF